MKSDFLKIGVKVLAGIAIGAKNLLFKKGYRDKIKSNSKERLATELWYNKEYEKAVKLYKEAAEQGNVRAQYNLGLCYENGNGVEQSYTEAVRWYRKAAEQGDAEAQYNLGVSYDHGNGVEQSYEEAHKWYKEAAEQGYAVAYANLGCLYEEGNGVSKDYNKALEFYNEAYANGCEDVKEFIDRLTAKMQGK